MNIWKVIANEGYNNAYLIDSSGKQCFDKPSDYMAINDRPPLRTLKIESTEKGFPDIINYWGTNGAIIVNSKVKNLIEQYYGTLSIQFLPCVCSNYQDLHLWILNVCEYHDVLDVNNCVCRKMHNFEGKEVIVSIKKYAFTKEAFDLDIFKTILNNRKDNISLFVSDRFKNIMEENNVTGLALEKVYSI
jgi:hypothetical protein